MKSYLENTVDKKFYEVKFDEEEDCLIIIYGNIGSKGKKIKIEYDEAEEIYGSSPEWALDEFIAEKIKEGFNVVLKPADLLKQLESINDLKLKGRIREFYESGEILNYQNKFHKELKCVINFDSRYAKTYSNEEYDEDIIRIAGKINNDGYEDEQNWIGIDKNEKNIPVYNLFTSSECDLIYDTFDKFLEKF